LPQIASDVARFHFRGNFHATSHAAANGGRAFSSQGKKNHFAGQERAMPTLDLAVMGLMAGYVLVGFIATALTVLLAANRH
jgi:hypothetical protein